MARLLPILLLLILSVAAHAQFTTSTNNNQISITGYTGAGGAVTISGTMNGLPVTSIGTYAFDGCSNVTSVTIPNSVTSIGDYAFGWSGLTTVTIPNSVTSIGTDVFNSCYSLTSATLPSGLTSIGVDMFENCYSLTSVTIPKGVTSIGASAFYNCSDLTSATIPNGVTSIGDLAFNSCISLVSATIPNSVTSIGTYVFAESSSLASVTIGSGITDLGIAAFQDCTSLTSVTIPNNITSIAEDAFNGCTGLISVTIPNSVTSIGDQAFQDCTSLTGVTIPNNVTSIGNDSFQDCSSLLTVTIPSSVTSIGDYAFDECSSLASAVFMGNAPTVGVSIFDSAASNFTIYFAATATGFNPYSWDSYTSLVSVSTAPKIIGGNLTGVDGTALVSYTIGTVGTVTSYGANGLPAGLFCNGLTGVLSGTPATSGTFSVTMLAYNPVGTGTGTLKLALLGPPTVVTGTASGITYNAATLNGTVDPNGRATTWYFQYGLTTTYGSTTASLVTGTTTTSAAVSGTIAAGLTGPTTYHYRLVGTNSSGTIYGLDQTFTTTNPPPTATTGPATGIAYNAATLSGTVNPNGLATTLYFQYGTTVSYSGTTAVQTGGSGTSAGVFSAGISGLTAATTYHYQIVAVNSTGTTHGLDQTFKTANPPPTVTTGTASGTVYNATTVSGTVNPNGLATTLYFQYGTTVSYGITSGSQAAGSGTSASLFSIALKGLTAATTYHYQMVAANSSGTTYGLDRTFATASLPAKVPVVNTGTASGVGYNGATINATVDPNGSATTCYFQYGLTAGYGISTGTQTAGSGTSAAPFSASITGLNPGTPYHYQIVAANSSGTTYGSDQTFTTVNLPPTVTTGTAIETSYQDAILTGTVNPNGLVTTVYFETGTDTTYAGATTTPETVGSGTIAVPCSAQIGNLTAGITYHYCLVGVSTSGTSYGGDQTFTRSTTSDADLSALKLTAGVLGTGFAPNVTSYTVNVDNNVATTTVTAASADPKASMKIQIDGGTYSTLKSGKASGVLKLNTVGGSGNLIQIQVTAQDGTVEIYSIQVNRAALPAIPVAYQGDVPAGMPNAKFTSFGNPAINKLDDVAFHAVVSGSGATAKLTAANNSGIWLDTGTMNLVVSTGTATLYQSGSTVQSGTFTVLGDPVLNNAGQVAFLGTVQSGTGQNFATRQGIWVTGTAGEGLIEMAQAQEQVPGETVQSGTATEVTIASFAQYGLTDQGGIVFLANLKTGGSVTAANSEGIWVVGTGGQPSLVARKGFPLVAAGANITALSIFGTPTGVSGQTRSFNAAGELMFEATLKGGVEGLYDLAPNGALSLAWQTSDSAAIASGSATFTAFSSPIVNDAGNAAFQATISGTGIAANSRSGIWAETGTAGTLSLVARLGVPTPYTEETGTSSASVTGTFTVLGNPVFNANDETAFIGTAKSGTGKSVTTLPGIWATGTGTSLGLSQVIQAKDQAPGCATGATFGAFTQLVLPDQGGAVFTANLALGPGGVTAVNNKGIWAVDTAGQLNLVAREGDVLIVSNGALKTIASLSIFSELAPTAGQTRSFNNIGDLVYKVIFTDSTQGIYKVVFP